MNDADVPQEGDVDVVPVKYDAIKLLTGAHSDKRPYIIVEVIDAVLVIITDENDNCITYEFEGKEYVMAQMDYTLGKILEKSEGV